MGKKSKITFGDMEDLRVFAVGGFEGLYFVYKSKVFRVDERFIEGRYGTRRVRGIHDEEINLQKGQGVSPINLCGFAGMFDSQPLRFRGKTKRDLDYIKLGKCTNPACNHTDIKKAPSPWRANRSMLMGS
jgi:hypothetical protein